MGLKNHLFLFFRAPCLVIRHLIHVSLLPGVDARFFFICHCDCARARGCAVQTTTTALYTVLSQSKAGYLFGTGVLLFCLGGNFAMFPALTSKARKVVPPLPPFYGITGGHRK